MPCIMLSVKVVGELLINQYNCSDDLERPCYPTHLAGVALLQVHEVPWGP